MLILIAVIVLIAALALYQASQGMYSSLIMAVATLLGAVLAFQFYRPVADLVIDRIPAQAHAVSLLAVFVVSLLVLRTAADKLLPGGASVGVWPDRIFGAAAGLFSGTIIVGMALIVVQMLPVGGEFFGYKPYADTLARTDELSPASPDSRTLELVSFLSSGSLGNGEGSFSQEHDDFLLELFCARNQVESASGDGAKGRTGRTDALPNALSEVKAYEGGGDWAAHVPQYGPNPGDVETRVLLVRASVDESARDENNWWMLPASHFRLVAREGEASRGYYPVGYLIGGVDLTTDDGKVTRQGSGWELITSTEGKVAKVGAIAVQRNAVSGKTKVTIDWVYRIPKGAVPSQLVFRRVAWQPIDAVQSGMPPVASALGKLVHAKPAVSPAKKK